MTRDNLIAEINHAADVIGRIHLEHDTEDASRTGAGIGVDLRRTADGIAYVMGDERGTGTAEEIADTLLARQWHEETADAN